MRPRTLFVRVLIPLVTFVMGMSLAMLATVDNMEGIRSLAGALTGGFLASLFLGRSLLHELDEHREWSRGFASWAGYPVPPPGPRQHPILDRIRNKPATPPEPDKT